MSATLRAAGSDARDTLSNRLEIAFVLAAGLPWAWLFGLYSLALRHRWSTGRWPAPMGHSSPFVRPPPGTAILDPKHFGAHYEVTWTLGRIIENLTPFLIAGFLLCLCFRLRAGRYAAVFGIGVGLMCAQLLLDPFGFFIWFMD